MQPRGEVRIALNVMRSRLTVVGFNLAVVTFQLNAVPRLPGAVQLPEISRAVHLATDITLLLALALSVIAMVCFIASSTFDQQGSCDHWSLLAGDLFMYLGLAQSVAGFFQPFVGVLDAISAPPPDAAVSLDAIYTAVILGGGAASLAASYVGPVVSLLRSPFGRAATAAMTLLYVLLLGASAFVRTEARRFEAVHVGNDPAAIWVLGALFEPGRW
jgi:hypothetical protein